MPIVSETLTELQYSDDRRLPLRIYFLNKDGSHGGGVWIRHLSGVPKDNAISAEWASHLVHAHMWHGNEVQICNAGDLLVFHAKGDTVIYPASAEDFWSSIK